ncbi:DUF1684 domain-containing protein [Deinococcus pimensis]|uniref:DUF1684 domain-containing protein n=1 Tax=Deinococcus pimensis TaxID=309888 RepID=UPI000486FE21|nr:DUF1684 domain-containing protein [Deinococcus pimensis]
MSTHEDHLSDILDFRRRKDEHFRTPNSPLSPQDRATFTGLAYYPPDPAWRVTAPVERAGDGSLVDLATTTGEPRAFALWGHADLAVPGGPVRLALYAPPGDERPARLFVPFRDATSGRETYGAGRYVEADVVGDHVIVDFNLAYHPYCAYGEGWTCPLPPAENWLTVPVTAGERDA